LVNLLLLSIVPCVDLLHLVPQALLKGETFRPLTPRHSGYAPGSPSAAPAGKPHKPHRLSAGKVRPEMITRVDVPVRINAMAVDGRLSDGDRHSEHAVGEEVDDVPSIGEPSLAQTADQAEQEAIRAQIAELTRRLRTSETVASLRRRRMSAPTSLRDRSAALTTLLSERDTLRTSDHPAVRFPRVTTIEFSDSPADHRQDLRLRHNRMIAPAEAGKSRVVTASPNCPPVAHTLTLFRLACPSWIH